MTDTCANCHSSRTRNFKLECHFSPPIRLPRKFDRHATISSRSRDETIIWGWPEVMETDWCEEHVRDD